VENPDTLILNLTFLGTVGVAFLMALVLFLLGVITLVLAGVGRLAAVLIMGLFRGRSRKDDLPLVQLYGTRLHEPQEAPGDDAAAASAGPPAAGDGAGKQRRGWRAALKPDTMKSALRSAVEHHPALTAARREPPVLADDWASAVAEADARAMARARAAAPDIKLSVRDLPDPRVPADKVAEVAPLVESALHNHRPPHEAPRSVKKPPHPPATVPLDTGSLMSLTGPQQVIREAAPGGAASDGKKPLP
jgi:hypothetical protein